MLCNVVGAEEPVEPEEYLIVSDEGSGASSESKKADPVNEEPDQIPIEKNDESEAAEDQSDDASDSEDGSADEVAPIDEPPPEVPPPNDEPTESADKATTEKPIDPKSDTEADSAPDETPATRQRPSVEGASFKGVIPSITTVDELEKAWGPPKEIRKTAAGKQHIHVLKPFKQVIATVVNGKVDTVLIHLDKLFEPKVLTKQLKLDDVEPATIHNGKGQMLGMAFPERGVLFAFATGKPVRVAQIVVEPINSQPFVTRAEEICQSRPTDALIDVEYAIEIDPEYDRAHAVRARILSELGQFDKALISAEKALVLAPHESEQRLTRAKILLHLQDYARTTDDAEKVIGDEKSAAILRAQAQMIWGEVLAAAPSHAFDEAIKHHTEAIKLAEQVSHDSAGPVSQTAKELLVDAHLAVAHDIAWGNWQQKPVVVPKWIDRASAFCDTLPKNKEAARFRVHEQTLHAYAGMKDAPDVSATIDAMTKLGRKLVKKELNTTRRQVLAWRLGEAMASAIVIAQAQGKPDAATQFGQQALAYFEQSGNIGEHWPARGQIVGKAYYQLGTVNAIDKSEHQKAIVWYNKAVPLLESSAAGSETVDSGRTGEMFVSMAVSYWEAGERKEAVRLTKQGAKLIEAAVADKRLPKAALAVPYGNLASMHAEMGDSNQSKQFTELADKADVVQR